VPADGTGAPVRRSLGRKAREALRALATRELSIEFERIPISFSGVPYRKIVNWLAVETAIALRRVQPWGRPTHVQIEPSSRCNLRCTYCPVGSESGPTGHMSPELFRKFVDDVHRHALVVVLWGWGEPFVCPSVYEMVRYAHERGLRVVSSTNGHLFTRPEHARGVVGSGLDVLIVSLSGTSQETYEQFRGGRLATALDGVREIVAEKRRRGVRTPHVQLGFIVTQWSESDVPGLLDLARSLGVDGLSLKRMNTASVKPVAGRVDESLPRDQHLQRFRYDEGQVRRRVAVNPCKALWHNATLRWDGRINPCVYDFDGEHVLGDAGRDAFGAIWAGERYRSMRRRFRRDWESIPICSRCTYAYEGGNYTDVIADTWFFDAAGRIAGPERAGRT
jgi:radical SAM protein with 4Fe4S-binding SPASM domain